MNVFEFLLFVVAFGASYIFSLPQNMGSSFSFTGSSGVGDGTFYSSTSGTDGHCSYSQAPTDSYAAFPLPLWNNGYYCGMCAQIQGPIGTVTVKIVDECAGCQGGSIDMSPSAFTQIADMNAGRVPITWNFVPCPASLAVPLSLVWVGGSNSYWFAFVVYGNNYPIQSLTVNGVALSAQADNTFQGHGNPPLNVQITYSSGQVLSAKGLNIGDAGKFQ